MRRGNQPHLNQSKTARFGLSIHAIGFGNESKAERMAVAAIAVFAIRAHAFFRKAPGGEQLLPELAPRPFAAPHP